MWVEYFRIARKVIWANRFRSILTVVSIAVGAFSVTLMTSLGKSGQATLMAHMEEIGGARLIGLWAKNPERAERKLGNHSSGLTKEDAALLHTAVPYVQDSELYASRWRDDVMNDLGASTRASIAGGDADFFHFFKLRVKHGRSFTAEENERHAPVCVVGEKLAKDLWSGDALGHHLGYANSRCQIVGVLGDSGRWNGSMDFDWDNLVVFPYWTLKDISPTIVQYSTLMFRTDDKAHNDIAKRVLNALLTERHHGVDDYEIWDFALELKKFEKIFDIMKLIVGMIASIALFIGGIGVMNIMLVSVQERVREIGIRKALGASPQAINRQFLLEAILLSAAGGFFGIALGYSGSFGANLLIKWARSSWVGLVSWPAMVAALTVSVTIGVVFGYFPARRAARLDAVAAMRR